MQVSLSMRIPEQLALELSALAEATGRSKSFLTIEALKAFIQTEKWQVEKIQQGIKEADAGNFATEEEIHELDRKWEYNAD